MMDFTVDQIEDLKTRASVLWATLEHRHKNGYTPEMQIAFLVSCLQSVCEMGYGIARTEISSSPWEYRRGSLTESEMNELSVAGWKPYTPYHKRSGEFLFMIYRRRKAVRDAT